MENVDDEKPISEDEVNENLKRVNLGLKLTRPLKQLNKNCDFRERYNEWCDNKYGYTIEEQKRREYQKIYNRKWRKDNPKKIKMYNKRQKELRQKNSYSNMW